MKRILYIALAYVSIISAVPTQNAQTNNQFNWRALRANYKHNDECLKKAIREQILSDFLVAGCHENACGQTRMLMEIMSNHMNDN